MQKSKNLAREPHIVVHTGDGDDVSILKGAAEIVNVRVARDWHE